MNVYRSRQQKNKNTVLHAYNIKIGGLEKRFFETRVDPSKMNESNLPTIEVMPFKNMSNDDEPEYFPDGVTEDIIVNLSS
jgi:adenylate cyclase